MPKEYVRIKQEVTKQPEFVTIEIETRVDEDQGKVKQEPVWEENISVETNNSELLPGIEKDGYSVTIEMKHLKEEAVADKSSSSAADEDVEPHQFKSTVTEELEMDKSNTQTKRTISDLNYECHTCGKKFSLKPWLERHVKIYHTSKLFTCSICNKQFTYQCKLTAHERIHTGAKPFSCKLCNKKFANKCNLVTHERLHTGEHKRISCDICQKMFAQKQHLESHMRTHTGQKPFACEICHDIFSQKQHVKTHMLIHTGEKPYECKICKKRFKRASDIRRHERIHTGEKPYACKLCSKRFVQKQHLVIHITYNRCSAMKPGG